MPTPAAELRAELLQGLAYYAKWEDDERHQEEVERQSFIRCEVEEDGRYAELAYNGELLSLGKLCAVQHAHAWLELHVLPKLDAAIPERDTLKAQAERGELMMPEVAKELDQLEAEVAQWRNAHYSVVVQKRRLSAKYGAIMRRKPAARWKRMKKRIKRRLAS